MKRVDAQSQKIKGGKRKKQKDELQGDDAQAVRAVVPGKKDESPDQFKSAIRVGLRTSVGGIFQNEMEIFYNESALRITLFIWVYSLRRRE